MTELGKAEELFSRLQRQFMIPKGEFVAWAATKGPYKSDVLNTRLAAAKRWLKERQSERTK